MNVKQFLVMGAAATGWMLWAGGYGQAVAYAQDQGGSGPSERAQVPGASDSEGRSVPDGGMGAGPSGQTSHGVPRTNGMDTLGEGSGHRDMRMPQQGAVGGLPGPGSPGSTLGGGGTNSFGPTSGGAPTGMGARGGASSSMGGSAGMGASGGAGGGR